MYALIWCIITCMLDLSMYKREKPFHKLEKGDIGIREKAHKQDTSQTQHLIPPSSLQHPPHLFNTSHAQPLHLIFKACFSPNHSTPIRNSILTPTKSQSKYSTIIMILYACTNEKYLIPISVPILPHTTESYPRYNFALMVEGVMV